MQAYQLTLALHRNLCYLIFLMIYVLSVTGRPKKPTKNQKRQETKKLILLPKCHKPLT